MTNLNSDWLFVGFDLHFIHVIRSRFWVWIDNWLILSLTNSKQIFYRYMYKTSTIILLNECPCQHQLDAIYISWTDIKCQKKKDDKSSDWAYFKDTSAWNTFAKKRRQFSIFSYLGTEIDIDEYFWARRWVLRTSHIIDTVKAKRIHQSSPKVFFTLNWISCFTLSGDFYS